MLPRRIVAALTFALLVTSQTFAASGSKATSRRPAREGAPGAEVDSARFRPARAPRAFRFPRDHASHPDFRTEWWYYTGHLRAGRRRLGYELTFFRVGLTREPRASRWAPHTLHFVHAALTDETRGTFRFDEQAARPALGLAGADTARYDVWVHGDSARLGTDGARHELRARTGEFALRLELLPSKPPVIHGENGVSRKAAGPDYASHYVSLTRMATRGTVVVDRDTLEVEGSSWMDHEFGSGRLDPAHAGWDWFGLQLDDGRELMLYAMRRRDGGVDPFSSGTLVGGDGRARHLTRSEWAIEPLGRWRSPATGADYPAGWRVRVPAEALELMLTPTVPDQELRGAVIGVTYWEGSVAIRGRARGRPVAGEGYVELTGYAGRAPGVE